MKINNINTLTKKDVISIHDVLIEDFKNANDPISPSGVKNEGLLESAIARQFSGYGDYTKYNLPISNAATLCYGLCCNHPLHNGNKRTALVSMLCHLDRNNLTFNGRVDQNSMYKFILKVASHGFSPKRKKRKTVVTDSSDIEIEKMSSWIRSHTRKIKKSERIVSFRELEKILKKFNVIFERSKGNFVDVYKIEKIEVKGGIKNLFRKKVIFEKKYIANIPYFKNRRHVGKGVIKTIRNNAKLIPSDGVDSDIFYGDATTTDEFIMKYKGTLNRLAKTWNSKASS